MESAPFAEYSGAEASGSEFSVDQLTGMRRRRNSRQEERRHFADNRVDAVQDAVLQVDGMYWGTMLVGIIVISIATLFEMRSLYVLFVTYSIQCDQPLWRWLLGHVCLSIFREFCITPLKHQLLLIHVVWTFYGFYWYGAVTTCRSSNPELVNWVEIVLIVAATFLSATTLLPLMVYLTIALLVALVDRGMISNRKAARDGTLELLEVVQFDPHLFAPPDSPDDSRPAEECCCCAESFNSERIIVKTPCSHYYHKGCLGDWLKLARTCPLCRCDLEAAVDWNAAPAWSATPVSQ